MRKFYIYIALLFMANSLFSQTAPVQHQFNFRGVQKYLSADSSYFQQNKFLLGWHWNLYKIKDCSALIQQRSCDLFVASSILFGFQAA